MTFASSSPTNETDITKAFLAKFHVNAPGPHWYVNFGAFDHMVLMRV